MKHQTPKSKIRVPIFLILLIAGLWLGVPTDTRAAAAAATAGGIVDATEMAIERLGGSHGLKLEVEGQGEKGAEADRGKGPKDSNTWKDEEEDEEQEEAEKERKRKEAEKEKTATEGNEGNEGAKSEAELEIEAFTQKVSDLEKKLEEASDDEKATVQAELDEANEGLKLWTEEAEKNGAHGVTRPTDFAEEQEKYVKSIEQQAAEVTKEKEELATKVAELEQQLAQAGEAPIGAQEIHPLMYTDKPEVIEQTDAQLAAFEKWAIANWDGTEETTDGKGKVTPGYAKEAVRARYQEIKEMREKLIPMARQVAATRSEGEKASRKIYPELFDSKRPEFKVAQSLLKAAPVLKAILGPNVYTIIGDAIVGEKVRAAKAKKLPTARGGAPGQGNGAARKNLPRAAKPGGGGGAGAGVAAAAARAAKKGKEPVLNMDAFMGGGGDKAALIKALS